MRKLRSISGRINGFRLARVILGAALLLSILLINIPFAVFAEGPTCNLACCAGRPPHAAGSCMDGSCHASLGKRAKTRHAHVEAHLQGEQLCGLSQIKFNPARLLATRAITIEASTDASRHDPPSTDRASISTSVLTKPCQSDCSSCAMGFTSSNRHRNSAALTHAERPRPPSEAGLQVKSDFILDLNARSRRDAPRGPPSCS